MLQRRLDLPGPARRDHTGVGDEEGVLGSEIPRVLTRELPCPHSEHDLGCDKLAELAQLAEVVPPRMAILPSHEHPGSPILEHTA
jgi:hypothetical protein